MKVCHLTSVHPAADTRVFHRQCCSLASLGLDVTLVAPEDDSVRRNGVDVEGIGKPRSRWQRLTRTQWRLLRKALATQADLYQFHDPELIPAGLLLKLLGKRVVYDIHEDIPRTILDKDWIPQRFRPFVSRCVETLENLACRAFDGLITVTEPLATRFPADRITLVRNYPILDELIITPDRREPDQEQPPTIGSFVYVGAISGPRGVTEMVDAMESVNQVRSATLTLAGRIVTDDYQRCLSSRPGWTAVDYRGFCDRSQVASMLADCRAGLVTLHATPNHSASLPTKLFEYMSAGVPVIASNNQPWCEIVRESGCGLLVCPTDAREIADAMLWILEHPEEAAAMGRRGRLAIEQHYNWNAEFSTLLSLYTRVTGMQLDPASQSAPASSIGTRGEKFAA